MKALRSCLACFLVGLACTIVGGQVSAPDTIDIRDEGTSQGRVRAIDFVGAGVTAAVAGGTATVTVSGGGGGGSTLTEIEIDFGHPNCGTVDVGDLNSPDHCQATITDATVTATSKIIAFQAGIAATLRDQDENDLDQFVCNANPGTGSFVLFCRGVDDQPLFGKFKVWYLVTT